MATTISFFKKIFTNTSYSMCVVEIVKLKFKSLNNPLYAFTTDFTNK